MSKPALKIVKLVGLGLIALLCVLLFPPLRTLLLGAYMALGATWQLVTDLLSIGFVTFIFAGLLSPWKHWAGGQGGTAIG